ncbi:MAG: hypothetical protein II844_10645 [Prevotella sp.]|nr:hypothetical protein [Prevotella sp.]
MTSNITGYGVAVAQDLINEDGYDCDDEDLGHYISPIPCDGVETCRSRCESCGHYYDCDDIDCHSMFCVYVCPRCNQSISPIDISKHFCQGSNNSSGGGGGGGGNGGSGGGGSGGGGPMPSSPPEPLPHASPSAPPAYPDSYHRCPCLMTYGTKCVLKQVESSPYYYDDDEFPGLTDGIRRHIANPETVQQGNNGTCGAAAIQKWLAANFPEQYAECVYSLAHKGYYEPWNLEFQFEDGETNPMGMTEEDLNAENGINRNVLEKKGIDYTYADAIMQSAIQTWVNTQDAWNQIDDFLDLGAVKVGYDPRDDNGKGGGMNHDAMVNFIKMVAGDAAIVQEVNQVTDYSTMYDKIRYELDNDFDSYTVLAGVNLKHDGKNYYFEDGGEKHILEITGINAGKYDIWSYGSDYTTSNTNRFNDITDFLIIKNTQNGKIEKANRKTLTCNCSNCSGDGSNCRSCMSR